MERRRGARARCATALVVVTAVAVVLVGCKNGGSAKGAVPVCPPAPGVTDDRVTLGMIFTDTGLTTELFRPARSGIQARVGEANAAGGVHGRTVELDWRDDESELDGNLTAARSLVEETGVFGIVESTSVASGGAAYLAEVGVPVTGNTLEPVWSQFPNMFSYANRIVTGPSATTWGEFARSHGGSRAVVVGNRVSQSSTAVSAQVTASLQAMGVEIVGEIVDFTPGVTNLERLGSYIANNDVDVVTGALPALNFVEIVDAARAAGAQIDVAMSPTGYDQAVLDEFGARAAGIFFFVNYTPFEAETAGHSAFLDSMVRYSPELQPPQQELALTAYMNTDLFLRGLEAAGECPTREGFIRNLREVDDYDANGLVPSAVNIAEVMQTVNLCYTFLRADDAGTAFELVPGATPLCGQRLDDDGAAPAA